jgi:hypothetical protein
MNDESSPEVEFFLVPRAPEGDLTDFGRGITSAVCPGGFTLDLNLDNPPVADSPHGAVLAELVQLLLNPPIHLPSPNPFLVLKREFKDDPASEPLARCQCQCGASTGTGATCGGGGGGAK